MTEENQYGVSPGIISACKIPVNSTDLFWGEKWNTNFISATLYTENCHFENGLLLWNTVRLDPSIKETFYKKGFFLMIISGCITGHRSSEKKESLVQRSTNSPHDPVF